MRKFISFSNDLFSFLIAVVPQKINYGPEREKNLIRTYKSDG